MATARLPPWRPPARGDMAPLASSSLQQPLSGAHSGGSPGRIVVVVQRDAGGAPTYCVLSTESSDNSDPLLSSPLLFAPSATTPRRSSVHLAPASSALALPPRSAPSHTPFLGISLPFLGISLPVPGIYCLSLCYPPPFLVLSLAFHCLPSSTCHHPGVRRCGAPASDMLPALWRQPLHLAAAPALGGCSAMLPTLALNALA